MLTKQDLQEIKSIVDTSIDSKLEQKLEPIHKKLNTMQKSLDTTVKYFDTITTDHEKRLKNVEKKIEVLPLVAALN